MRFFVLSLIIGVLGTGCAHNELSNARPLILTDRSSDVTADIKRMWETAAMKNDPDKIASTRSALEAADRVFSTVQLQGMTHKEVIALLGDPITSSESIYHFPFYDSPKESMVYRFDNGFHGWEFYVIFKQDRVLDVERYVIE